MQIDSNHVSYCTNVHPAETFDELIETLNTDVAAVKAKVAPNRTFGVGLRLSAQMVLSMDEPRLNTLNQTLADQDFYVFSVNGFPYGDFGVGVVKTDVYSPGWHDVRRLDYTKAIADVLVQLPGPSRRTISTVALGFKPEYDSEQNINAAVEHLRVLTDYLFALEQRTGIHVELCLEPEPGTFLEVSEDVVAFFLTYGFVDNTPQNQHIALCYDTCHQAVMFEDAVDCLETLTDAGVRIGKMQISNAILLNQPDSVEQRAALQSFSEPRFLHQVVTNDGALFALDLPDVQSPDSQWLNASEWRCHFHVPLHWTGNAQLGTTDAEWRKALDYALEHALCTHYEIETYTWGVLPKEQFDADNIAACVSAEFDAVMPHLKGHTP
jgi:hypothetical protein